MEFGMFWVRRQAGADAASKCRESRRAERVCSVKILFVCFVVWFCSGLFVLSVSDFFRVFRGLFWKGEPRITRKTRKDERLRTVQKSK